jgi:hypothetical protein
VASRGAAVSAAREVRDLSPAGRDTRAARLPARASRRQLRRRRARSGPKIARVERREARSGLPRTAASRKRGVAPYERDRNEDTASRRSSRPSVRGGRCEAEGKETRGQQRVAGTKKTARRRQGYGGLAYLPAEASAKAGALFDIVNREMMRATDCARIGGNAPVFPAERAKDRARLGGRMGGA